MSQGLTYFLVQLGCAMNHADGERIASVLNSMGYQAVDREEDALLLGVVACSVRQKAIDKVYSKIAKWNGWKLQKPLLTFVSGCILPSDREKFLDRFDLVFSISEIHEVPNLIATYGVPGPYSLQTNNPQEENTLVSPSLPQTNQRPTGPMWLKDSQGPSLIPGSKITFHQGTRDIHDQERRELASKEALQLLQSGLRQSTNLRSIPIAGNVPETKDVLGGFWHIEPSYQSTFEAHLPIQNGCDKFCTFCAVPYTRGREVSRPSESILQEITKLLEGGYKSITLLGQNVNSYGLDKKGDEITFPQLLEAIAQKGYQLKKDFWLYFTAPHPKDMTLEVLETMARHDSIAKQVHLPLQSGDDKVLIKMNRKHTIDEYRSIVSHVRRLMPSATLFTDIIVGFTGETEEQFTNSQKAMVEFQFSMAFIAQYSPRPGAASDRWQDDVSLDEKKRRLGILTNELHRSSLQFNQSLVGQTLKILVSGYDEKTKYLQGYTEGRINVRFSNATHDESKHLVGTFVRGTITKARDMSVEAELV